MNTTFSNEQIEDVRRLNKVAGATCPECKGVNGHATPFCSRVDLQSVLGDATTETAAATADTEGHQFQHCAHCDGELVSSCGSYVHVDPQTSCIAFGGAKFAAKPVECRLTAEEQLQWWTTLSQMPMPVTVKPTTFHFGYCDALRRPLPYDELWITEKDAINAARKLRIDEMDRLQAEVNALDARYDAIEDAEMKAEG